MHESSDVRPDGPQAVEHFDVRFETKDVRLGNIVFLLIVIGIVLAVQFTIVWTIFRAVLNYEAANKQSPYPMAENRSNALPREPRLEPLDRLRNDPAGNLDREQAELERFLNSSGTTSEKGFVHIPIEAAMKEVAGQLPIRKQPPAGEDAGVFQAGASNSGRKLPGAAP